MIECIFCREIKRMSVKISVITYVKNDVSHINMCIESVIQQTFRDLEFIIVDGGSTDGTREVLDRYMEKDSRIRVLSSDLGVGRQFNTGLRAAKGEYIGICESDDFLNPEMYEKEYEIAKLYDLDFLQANFNSIYEVSGVIHRVPFFVYKNDVVYNKLLCPCEEELMLKVNASGFWSGLYKRQFLLDNDIFMNETPGASYQDTSFSFLTKIFAKRAWVMRDSFYEYRMDNIHSSTNDPKRMMAIITEYDLLEKRIKESGLWKLYKEYYIKLRIQGVSWFYSILNNEGRDYFYSILKDDITLKIESGNFALEKCDDFELSIISATKNSKASLDKIFPLATIEDPMIKRFESEINNIPDKRKVVIFGAGKLGEKLWLFLAERGIVPIAFADNSRDKVGSIYCNTKVMDPQSIIKKYGDCNWIIANLRHTDDIIKQIKEMDMDKKCIIICPGFVILNKIMPN